MSDLALSALLQGSKAIYKAQKKEAAVIGVRYHYEKHDNVIKGLTCNSKKVVHYKHLYSIIAKAQRFYFTKEYVVGIAWDFTPLINIANVINRCRDYFTPGSKMNKEFFHDTFLSDISNTPGLNLVDCVEDGERYLFFKFK